MYPGSNPINSQIQLFGFSKIGNDSKLLSTKNIVSKSSLETQILPSKGSPRRGACSGPFVHLGLDKSSLDCNSKCYSLCMKSSIPFSSPSSSASRIGYPTLLGTRLPWCREVLGNSRLRRQSELNGAADCQEGE